MPTYSFGENDTFRQLRFREGSLGRRLQQAFKERAGFAPCLFSGRGLLPFAAPITVVGKGRARRGGAGARLPRPRQQPSPPPPVSLLSLSAVGQPIPVPRRPSPAEEEVDHYHALYADALLALFEAHKGRCGLPPSAQLVIA